MSEDTSGKKRSIVIVNTGDGKGKSSAAFGVMGRAWAHGRKVVVVQFIKSPKWQTGEQKLAAHLGIEWHTMGDGFTWDSTDMDVTRQTALSAWQKATELLAAGRHDLVILDELTYLITFGWLEASAVVDAVEARPPQTSVIITGRDAAPELVDLADTVSEVKKVKHAFDQGVMAMKGIEY